MSDFKIEGQKTCHDIFGRKGWTMTDTRSFIDSAGLAYRKERYIAPLLRSQEGSFLDPLIRLNRLLMVFMDRLDAKAGGGRYMVTRCIQANAEANVGSQ